MSYLGQGHAGTGTGRNPVGGQLPSFLHCPGSGGVQGTVHGEKRCSTLQWSLRAVQIRASETGPAKFNEERGSEGRKVQRGNSDNAPGGLSFTLTFNSDNITKL